MNIPNTLSVFRIIIIPIFCFKFITAEGTLDYIISAVILAISGLTDLLDGFIARRCNMITQLGKVLDPVADKLTLFGVCGCLWIKYPELGWIFMLFILKEAVIMLGSLLLMKEKIKLDGSKWFGKLYTVLFYGVMLLLILFNNMAYKIKLGLLIFLAIFTFMSLIMYIPVFFRLKKNG